LACFLNSIDALVEREAAHGVARGVALVVPEGEAFLSAEHEVELAEPVASESLGGAAHAVECEAAVWELPDAAAHVAVVSVLPDAVAAVSESLDAAADVAAV